MPEGSQDLSVSPSGAAGQCSTADRTLAIPISDWLLWTAIVLSPLQDTAIQLTPLKLFGACPSVFPLSILLLLYLVRQISARQLMIRRSTLMIVAYMAAICAASLVWVYIQQHVLYWRLLRSYTLSLPLILLVIFELKYRNNRGLRNAVYIAYALTIVGVACGQFLGPNAIPPLQVSVPPMNRPHGFSTEPSTLSVQIVSSGMLAAHFLLRRWQKTCVCALTCGLLVFSDSKGGLISLLLCIVVLAVVISRSSLALKLGTLIVVIPAMYFGIAFLASRLTTLVTLQESTSIATRLSMTTYAILTAIHYPLGVGISGFIPSVLNYLPQAIEICKRLSPYPLNFGEVQAYLTPPFTYVDCKTFFFNFLVFFGIPFVIVYVRFVGRLLTSLIKHRQLLLFVGVLFVVLASTTYYSSVNLYSIPLLLGVSVYETRKSETSLRVS